MGEVLSLRETLEKIRIAPEPDNETEVKFQIVAPLLMALGWDSSDRSQVAFEHQVKTAQRRPGRVDIALKREGHILAHLETKGPFEDLDRHVDQLLRYRFVEVVYVGVLTNGSEWRFYLPREAGPNQQPLFCSFDLRTDPIGRIAGDLKAFLSRDSLRDGSAEELAKQVLEARREIGDVGPKLPELWSKMLNTPDENLVDLISEQAFREFRLRPDPRQVRALLRGEEIPAAEPKTTAPDQLERPGEETPPPQVKPVAFELWGRRYEVRYWKDILEGVATLLYERHVSDFRLVLDRKKRTRPYASKQKERFKTARLIGDSGIYLDTNLTAKGIEARARELLELFEHSPEFLTIETEAVSAASGSTGPSAPYVWTYQLWETRHEVRYWKDVLIGVTTLLYQKHGHRFDRILGLGDPNHPYASINRRVFKSAGQVGNSGIYIPTNMRLKRGTARLHELLEFFGHSPDELTIETPPNQWLRSKPTAFELWGTRQEVSTWKEVLVGVTTQIYRSNPTDFDQILNLGGRKPYASLQARLLGSPEPVGDSGIYIETRLNSSQVVGRCEDFLRFFGHSPQDLTIENR